MGETHSKIGALVLLAHAVGEPVERVRTELGEEWSLYPEDFTHTPTIDAQLQGSSDDPILLPTATTFATGDPLAAFITVIPGAVAHVFNPEGQWPDPGTLVYVGTRPGPPVPLGAPDTIERLAARLKQVRRSARATLRRCENCRELTRPEHWFGDGCCDACASTQLGVVF